MFARALCKLQKRHIRSTRGSLLKGGEGNWDLLMEKLAWKNDKTWANFAILKRFGVGDWGNMLLLLHSFDLSEHNLADDYNREAVKFKQLSSSAT